MQQKFREFEKGELTKIRLILHLTLAFFIESVAAFSNISLKLNLFRFWSINYATKIEFRPTNPPKKPVFIMNLIDIFKAHFSYLFP